MPDLSKPVPAPKREVGPFDAIVGRWTPTQLGGSIEHVVNDWSRQFNAQNLKVTSILILNYVKLKKR